MNIINTLKTSLNKHIYTDEERFLKDKISVLNIAMITMGITLLGFSLFRYYQHEYFQATADIFLFIAIIFSYIVLSKNKKYFLPIARFLLLFAIVIILLIIVLIDNTNTRFTWIGVITYLMFYLLGKNEGKLWFLGVMLTITLLYFTNIINISIAEFSTLVLTSLFIAFFLIQYENIKKNSENAFLNNEKELENTVNERTSELQEQKDMFENLFQKSYDGILLIENSMFIKCNDAVTNILGYSNANELLNTHPSELSPEFQPDGESSKDKINKMMDKCLIEGANNFEWVHKKSNGENFWCDVTLTYLKLKDKDIIHAVLRDISEKKALEVENKKMYNNLELEVQKRTEELHFAMKTKDDFLANMSHEIRTPLNAILGFIDILQKDEIDKERKKYFNIITTSGESLLTIINDILDFSKMESGKLEIENKAFKTLSPFEDIHLLFFEKAKEKDITLTLNVISELPEIVLGDIVRVKQIVSNILSNAIKFTQKDGLITTEISYDNKTQKLYCTISDTGIGMNEDSLSHIFDSFAQADSSTTRKYGGTGLGLSISKHLVKLMNGTIVAKSSLGKGSSFIFNIELQESKNQDIEDIQKKLIDTNFNPNNKILVVEDNKANQMLLKLMFKKLKLDCDMAENGLEAVKKVQEKEYDIILMDENMPVMNGIEATKEIRKLGFKNIPIIAVTANSLKGDKEKFIASGMNDYISKPINNKEFLSVLRKYLQ